MVRSTMDELKLDIFLKDSISFVLHDQNIKNSNKFPDAVGFYIRLILMHSQFCISLQTTENAMNMIKMSIAT